MASTWLDNKTPRSWSSVNSAWDTESFCASSRRTLAKAALNVLCSIGWNSKILKRLSYRREIAWTVYLDYVINNVITGSKSQAILNLLWGLFVHAYTGENFRISAQWFFHVPRTPDFATVDSMMLVIELQAKLHNSRRSESFSGLDDIPRMCLLTVIAVYYCISVACLSG